MAYALFNEGEENILYVYLRNEQAPTAYALMLFNDTIAETDTVADLAGEPSGSGYARQTIERSATGWPTVALDSGDFMATSKAVVFTATGTLSAVTKMALITNHGTPKLIAYVDLAATRTLTVLQSLECYMTVKMG